MNESTIDPIIHPLPRLKICAALARVGAINVPGGNEMAFGALRDTVQLSDASLSKHLKTLEEAGYIRRFREYGSARKADTVWVSLSERGAEAFHAHLAALREIAEV